MVNLWHRKGNNIKAEALAEALEKISLHHFNAKIEAENLIASQVKSQGGKP